MEWIFAIWSMMWSLTAWYVLNMPAFIPVAIGISALRAIRFPASRRSIRRALGLAAMSALYADIGFLIVWIALTGQFGPLIGIPLFFLWIIGFVLAVPTILSVWLVVKSIAKN
jgi:hypothetical protein